MLGEVALILAPAVVAVLCVVLGYEMGVRSVSSKSLFTRRGKQAKQETPREYLDTRL